MKNVSIYFKNFIKFAIYNTVNSQYDNIRYIKYSYNPLRIRNVYEYSSYMIKEAHRIEKGMALPRPRTLFAKDVVLNLLYNLKKYHLKFNAIHVDKIAIDTIKEYIDFNIKNDVKDNFIDYLQNEIKKFNLGLSTEKNGGTIVLVKNEILKKAKIEFANFVNSRHSIRNFSADEVDINLIKKSIEEAIRTPSVCNRQPWKAHVFADKKIISEVLGFQNGNRGFSDKINKLIMITSTLGSFSGIIERYEQWIDGGMFAMSLVYALHARGLATCCLNWSVGAVADIKMKKKIKLKQDETIVMFIAVGHMPEKVTVCISDRKKVDEVMQIHRSSK